MVRVVAVRVVAVPVVPAVRLPVPVVPRRAVRGRLRRHVEGGVPYGFSVNFA